MRPPAAQSSDATAQNEGQHDRGDRCTPRATAPTASALQPRLPPVAIAALHATATIADAKQMPPRRPPCSSHGYGTRPSSGTILG
eukprot:1093564-Prymnesium_polylepis.2